MSSVRLHHRKSVDAFFVSLRFFLCVSAHDEAASALHLPPVNNTEGI